MSKNGETKEKKSNNSKKKATTKKTNQAKKSSNVKRTRNIKKENNIRPNVTKDEESKVKSTISIDENIVEEPLTVKEVNINEINEQIKENELKKLEKIKKKYNVIEPFFVIILLLLCFFFLYKYILVSPKAIINSATSELLNNVTNLLDFVDKNNLGDKYNLTANATISSTNDLLNNYSKYNYKFELNKIKESAVGKMEINDSASNVATLLFELIDKNLYLKSEAFYYYPLKLESVVNNNIDISKYKKTIIKIKNIVNDEIENKNTTTEKKIIGINGLNVNTEVLKLYYNKEEANELILNIINKIKDDEELINDLAELLNISNDDFIKHLEEINLDNLNNINIKLYTNGFMKDVIGISVEINDKEMIGLYNYNGSYQIDLDKNENNITAVYNNNNLTISKNSVNILTLTINKNSDNVLEFNYSLNLLSKKYNGTLHIDNNDKVGKIDFSIINSSNASENLNIIINYSVNENMEVEFFNVEDAVQASDLTEDEVKSIIQNLKMFFEK